MNFQKFRYRIPSLRQRVGPEGVRQRVAHYRFNGSNKLLSVSGDIYCSNNKIHGATTICAFYVKRISLSTASSMGDAESLVAKGSRLIRLVAECGPNLRSPDVLIVWDLSSMARFTSLDRTRFCYMSGSEDQKGLTTARRRLRAFFHK